MVAPTAHHKNIPGDGSVARCVPDLGAISLITMVLTLLSGVLHTQRMISNIFFNLKYCDEVQQRRSGERAARRSGNRAYIPFGSVGGPTRRRDAS